MSRKRTIPPVPKHIDPEKAKKRKEKADARSRGSADAISRVLGAKKEEGE